MTGHDLRQLAPEDLRVKVQALREDLFRLRFRHATAQLNDPSQIRKTRRTLARALTILGQVDAAAVRQA
ncbi:MAG: 50S ribosomal protein L29 [Deltaproteobacteria bacterium]|nr:50S ribosomal protein L29 [Deltaproteobacteria bacterium]MCB9787361.1 50S ribosomal protein L29 [Deltaproteobacteria bacterium]